MATKTKKNISRTANKRVQSEKIEAKALKSKGKSNNPPYKRVRFWIFAGVVLAAIAGGAIVLVGKLGKSDGAKTEFFNNEKVDINGLIVSEACQAVRAKGWTVSSVYGYDGGIRTETSDCSDTTHKVSGVAWYDEKDDYNDKPTVSLVFVGKSRDNVAEPSDSNNGDAEAPSTVESTQPQPIEQPSSQTQEPSSSSDWRTVLKEYEQWMNGYVDFMKKYRNASSVDAISMLSDYSRLLKEMTDWSEKINDVEDTLSASDMTDFWEMYTRIYRKMSELE